jgi:two-component system, cell cycle sensor histidine kinase and response regulator CckA
MTDKTTILLVDDKVLILDICRQILEAKGYRVLIASTPSEAMHIAEMHDGEIHLLLTDVMMPGMNGVELSRRLSSLHKNIRTLFMSGYSANLLAEEGVDFDMKYLIHKPFTMEDLVKRVSSILKKT